MPASLELAELRQLFVHVDLGRGGQPAAGAAGLLLRHLLVVLLLLLLLPTTLLTTRHAAGHGGRGTRDHRSAGYSSDQTWHGVLPFDAMAGGVE